jgi:DNA-binding MarR family transcriptional regulator
VSSVTETRWLDEDEQRTWRALLEATQLLLEEVDGQLQRDAGLSHPDYEILVRLSEAQHRRMRMSELAERTLFSRSRLSHAVARLERDGLVRRVSCPSDKRGTYALLTDHGYDVLTGAAPAHVETVRRVLLDPLSRTQVAQLGRIVDAVRTRAHRPDPSGRTTPAC